MTTQNKTTKSKTWQPRSAIVGCPLTPNRTAWCFALCDPDSQGNGRCGRIAPHDLKGRTQLSIQRYNARMRRPDRAD